MNILILAAGLGTRLRPLTDSMPKALVPVGGKPLLQLLIEKIKRQCHDAKVVINLHHHGEQIIDFVHQNDGFGLDVKLSDERNLLLDTGGAVKHAAPLFDNNEPILIHNVDILSNINLPDFYASHLAHGSNADATLLVSDRETSRYLLFDDSGRMKGWLNKSTGEVRSPYHDIPLECLRKLAFSGIHVISHSLISRMNDWPDKFSIIDFYIKNCADTHIMADIRADIRMLDVGKVDSLDRASQELPKYQS